MGKESFEYVKRPPQPFMTGIIDPDWPYTVAPGMKDGAGKLSGFTRNRDTEKNQYKEIEPLSIEDLGKLPVGDLIGGYLFMWTVSPFLIGGLKGHDESATNYLIKSWGFEACSTITWAKWDKDRNAGYGGVGFWFLGNAEFCIVAKKSGMPSIRTGTSSLLVEGENSSPLLVESKQRHSSKPRSIHALAERRFPGPYLEIFGRYGGVQIPKTKNGVTEKITVDFGPPPSGWRVMGSEAPGDGQDIRKSMDDAILFP